MSFRKVVSKGIAISPCFDFTFCCFFAGITKAVVTVILTFALQVASIWYDWSRVQKSEVKGSSLVESLMIKQIVLFFWGWCSSGFIPKISRRYVVQIRYGWLVSRYFGNMFHPLNQSNLTLRRRLLSFRAPLHLKASTFICGMGIHPKSSDYLLSLNPFCESCDNQSGFHGSQV